MWKRWIAWPVRSRLEPMKRVARTIRSHLWGIVNAILLRVTNMRGGRIVKDERIR